MTRKKREQENAEATKLLAFVLAAGLFFLAATSHKLLGAFLLALPLGLLFLIRSKDKARKRALLDLGVTSTP